MEDFVPAWVAAAASFVVDPAWPVDVASSSFAAAASAFAFAVEADVLPFASDVAAAAVDPAAWVAASSSFGVVVAVHPSVPASAEVVDPSSAVGETVPFAELAVASPSFGDSASGPVVVSQRCSERGFLPLKEPEVSHRE